MDNTDPKQVDDLEAEYQKLRLGKDTRKSWKEKSEEDADGITEDHDGEANKKEEEEQIEWDDEMTVEQAATLKEEGNTLFKSSEWQESIEKYTQALRCRLAPAETRAIYYLNRGMSYRRLEEYEKTIDDTSWALKLRPDYDKARRVRKAAAEKTGKWNLVLEDAKALGIAGAELSRLEAKAKEDQERKQAEALGQLKEMGNSLLKTFGLSLDNFKMDKDPSSGSYNVRFENKK